MTPPDVPAADSALQRWLTFFGVICAAAVYAAAWTIPNAVLPQMQGDLSASLDQISWVITATAVTGAMGIPPTPWLAARFGTKRVMLCSLVGFTIASSLVGTADSLEAVVFYRVCQALLGSPLIALSQATTVNIFPDEQRSTALAIWSLGLASGWVFAPALGAYLAEVESWRLSFFVLAPMGFAAFLACAAFVPDSKGERPARFDWFGFVTLAAAITAFQVVLNQGQRQDWFDSGQIVTCTVVGVAGLYLYIVHTMTSRNSFLNWNVLRDRNFALGIIFISVHAYSNLTPLVLLPILLEELRGLEVLTIGLLLVPRGCAQMLTMLIAGPLVTRLGPRPILVAGLFSFAGSSWVLATFNRDIGIWDIVAPTVMQGVSMAMIWVATMTVVYSTVAQELRTSAATLVSLTFNLAGSVGVAVSVALITRTTQVNHEELAAHVVPTNEMLRFEPYAEAWDLENLQNLASMDNEITREALMIAYGNVFWMMAVIMLALVPLVPFVRTRAPAASS